MFKTRLLNFGGLYIFAENVEAMAETSRMENAVGLFAE